MTNENSNLPREVEAVRYFHGEFNRLVENGIALMYGPYGLHEILQKHIGFVNPVSYEHHITFDDGLFIRNSYDFYFSKDTEKKYSVTAVRLSVNHPWEVRAFYTDGIIRADLNVCTDDVLIKLFQG